MTINLTKMTALTNAEIVFVYSMLVEHGGMSEAEPMGESHKVYPKKKQYSKPQKPKNGSVKKKAKSVDKTKPSLYDFTDPLWDNCTDKNFLIFRVIMEKTHE